MNLATEFKKSAASSTPEEENSILSKYKLKSFLYEGLPPWNITGEDENIVSKIISETSLYYWRREIKTGLLKILRLPCGCSGLSKLFGPK